MKSNAVLPPDFDSLSVQERVKILFTDQGIGVSSVHVLNFPLKPDTYECHILGCATGLNATKKSLINGHGPVTEVHTCSDCYKEFNGLISGNVGFKKPFPGDNSSVDHPVWKKVSLTTKKK